LLECSNLIKMSLELVAMSLGGLSKVFACEMSLVNILDKLVVELLNFVNEVLRMFTVRLLKLN